MKPGRMMIHGGDRVCKSCYTVFITMLSGILLGLSFQSALLSTLAPIGLLPIAFALTRREHILETYVGAYLAGLIFNLIATNWMRTLDGGTGLAGPSAPDWLFQAQLLAMFWPVTVLLGRTFVKAVPLPMSLALPIVWAAHEFLVRHLWTAVDFTGWPLYFLGYSITNYPLLCQIGDLSGVSTISILIACLGGGIWDVYQVVTRRTAAQYMLPLVQAMSVPMIAILATCAYGTWRLAQATIETGPSVWLMPDKSLDTQDGRRAFMADVLGAATAPDLLLWSETVYDPLISELASDVSPNEIAELSDEIRSEIIEVASSTSKPGVSDLEQIAQQVGSSMLVGCTRGVASRSGLQKYNSAVFIDPVFHCRGYYDKIFLVPFWEFTPRSGLTAKKSKKYAHGSSYPVFSLRSAGRNQDFLFSASICYDIAFPQLYRRFMRTTPRAPDFFVVCSAERSDLSGRLSRDLLAIARLRAIECRRAFVRNVYCGYSGVIDSNGQLHHDEIEWEITKPTPVGVVPIDDRQTLFVLAGDWLSTLAVIALFVVWSWNAGGWLTSCWPRLSSTGLFETSNMPQAR